MFALAIVAFCLALQSRVSRILFLDKLKAFVELAQGGILEWDVGHALVGERPERTLHALILVRCTPVLHISSRSFMYHIAASAWRTHSIGDDFVALYRA